MKQDNSQLKKRFGRIGILMGGDSPERDISLKSGMSVYKALKEAGLECVSIDIKNTKDIDKLKDDILKFKIEIAFIAMHGAFGEDGDLQSILDELNIAYTGSGPQACKLTMDKVASKKVLGSNKILVPKCTVAKTKDMDYNKFCFPLVVKPSNSGSSIGLSIVRKKEDMENAFLTARNYSPQVIIEEYIEGEEVTVGILEDRALPVIMLRTEEEFYNYKAKYTAGLTEYLLPAPLGPEEIKLCQKTALQSHRALGLWHFSRVDMILNKSRLPVVLEVNSIPGLTPLSLLPKAAENQGLNFTQLCIKLIESACNKKKRK